MEFGLWVFLHDGLSGFQTLLYAFAPLDASNINETTSAIIWVGLQIESFEIDTRTRDEFRWCCHEVLVDAKIHVLLVLEKTLWAFPRPIL